MSLPRVFPSVRQVVFIGAVSVMGASVAVGQQATDASLLSETKLLQHLHDLQAKLDGLESAMTSMNAEMLRCREETSELRGELDAVRRLLAAQEPATRDSGITQAAEPTKANIPPQAGASEEERLQKLEEEQDILSARMQEQHQTKVESASKYRVKLSGAVILNLVSNRGAVDNLDFPSLVAPDTPMAPQGSFGATLRQSLIGLEVSGPDVKGAQVSADVQFDFAGGFPNEPDGVTLGMPRLRTGVIRFAGSHTTVVAGQDSPFFSPLSPSSFASLAVPEFAYTGNLWTWTPQVFVEHRMNLTENSSFLLQGGILDPLSGEPPSSPSDRVPEAGEASRQPAYATRVAWSHRLFKHEMTFGAGGYYSRQNWAFHRNVDGWAGTADWTVPLASRWELSGEFYRGRAIGGLGAAIGRSVVFNGPITDPNTLVHGLNAAGGWAQLKFQQTEKLEWNGGFGQDSSFAKDLRLFPPLSAQSYFDPSIARNRASFLNFIYRPRSNLVFSLEYRRMRTISILGDSDTADHINLSLGVLF